MSDISDSVIKSVAIGVLAWVVVLGGVIGGIAAMIYFGLKLVS